MNSLIFILHYEVSNRKTLTAFVLTCYLNILCNEFRWNGRQTSCTFLLRTVFRIRFIMS